MYRMGSSANSRSCAKSAVGARFRHAVVLMSLMGAGVAVMGAQTSASTSGNAGVALAGSTVTAPKTLDLHTTASEPRYSSSADEGAAGTFSEAKMTPAVPDFAAAMNAGGGQSGRRPRYGSSGWTNADGSDKWMGYGGAGFGVPVGNTRNYLTLGYGFQVGAGRQFNKHFALPIEFDWDHFGFTQQNLNDQTKVYNTFIYDTDPTAGTSALSGLVGGGSHVWSFSLQPTYTFYTSHHLGAYVEGGVGFYHKTAAFTVPALAFCGGYGGYGGYGYGGYGYGGGIGYGYGYGGVCAASATFDKYTSNAPGFDGGAGITYKFSDDSKIELYGDIRYVYVMNSNKPGITVNNLNAITATTTNFYPANSMHTEYIPIKFGIRF